LVALGTVSPKAGSGLCDALQQNRHDWEHALAIFGDSADLLRSIVEETANACRDAQVSGECPIR
jgi:hypothetical protein